MNEEKNITIRFNAHSLRIECSAGVPPDLVLAILWQAIGVVSAQIIQSSLSFVIPVRSDVTKT